MSEHKAEEAKDAKVEVEGKVVVVEEGKESTSIIIKDYELQEYEQLRHLDKINENIKPLLVDHYQVDRYKAFLNGIDWLMYECIPGDFLEFGVASGVTTLFIALANQRCSSIYGESSSSSSSSSSVRRVIGFDSFEGLPENKHPRWPKGIFKNNRTCNHPTLAVDESVTPEKICEMFDKCELTRPILVKGLFADTLKNIFATNNDSSFATNDSLTINSSSSSSSSSSINSLGSDSSSMSSSYSVPLLSSEMQLESTSKEHEEKKAKVNEEFKKSRKGKDDRLEIKAVALVHIDCDLYESCLDVLNGIKHLLQQGTLIYFDDWNNYKADNKRGERKAVAEFLANNPDITFEEHMAYTAFCKSFIVHRKSEEEEKDTDINTDITVPATSTNYLNSIFVCCVSILFFCVIFFSFILPFF